MKGTKASWMTFQLGSTPPMPRAAWTLTMSRVDSEPLTSTTDAMDNPSAASYEMSWADARTLPSSGYFEPDAQPASMMP